MYKDNLIYIDHIMECIIKIKNYCSGADYQKFENDIMLQDAVIRNIEIIGEASKKLSNQFRETNDHIPWNDMAGMRDKLIHDYFGVDIEMVWKTVTQDIPVLEDMISKLQN